MNKRELLEFLKFRDKFRLENINNTDFMAVTEWLKNSNHSQASDESRIIRDNESTKKICETCSLKYGCGHAADFNFKGCDFHES